MLRYVVRWLGSIVCLTAPVLSHHIPKAGSGIYVPYDFVDNVRAIVAFIVVIGVPFRTRPFLAVSFLLVGRSIIAMAP